MAVMDTLAFEAPIDPHFTAEPVSLLLVIVALFFICFGLFSQLIRGKYFVPSPVLAIVLGIILGPKCLKLLASPATNDAGWVDGSEGEKAREFLTWACRIVLAIQVLSAGLNLPSRWVARKQNLITLCTLLFPVMISACVLSGLFAYAIIPGMLLAEAMVIGSCLGPTDPVLAGSVIGGKFAERHVDKDVRDVLLAESGVNDGLGTPYLYLALSILFATSDLEPTAPHNAGGVIGHYLVSVVLWNVALSFIIGIVAGDLLRRVLKVSKEKDWIDQNSMLVFSVAVAMALVGITTMLDTNQLLCCFVAGCVMNWQGKWGEILRNEFTEGLDNILDIIIFTVLGSVLPFDTWKGEDSPLSFGKLCIVATLVMFFRRLPLTVLAAKGLPSIPKFGEVIFAGWFGPIGIGALYYSLEAAEKIPGSIDLEYQTFQIVSFLVFISVFVHGLTIPFFLVLTFFFPGLATFLLGERHHVAEDFGQASHLTHLLEGDSGSAENGERTPLLKGSGQQNGEAQA